MARHLSNILDITPHLNKKWTVLVHVLESGQTETNKDNKQYRRVLIIDSQGTEANAMIFQTYLNFYENNLLTYRRYYISNALVKETDPKFRMPSYGYTWYLSTQTLVEGHPESIPPPLPCSYQFTPFGELHKHAETENYQNVRGVVIKCFPTDVLAKGNDPVTKKDVVVTKKDVVIVNEEKKPMILTMWNSFSDKGQLLDTLCETGPLTFAMRVKVTTFHGLSLSTKMGSTLMINPPVKEDLHMQQWFNENKAELKDLLNKKAYTNTDMLLPYPQEEDIVSITQAIENLKTRKTAWVKGPLTLPKQDRSFTHTACANCLKSIEADVSWVIKCPSCKTESQVKLMLRATFEIKNGSTSIRGTISNTDIEKFIPFTPAQVKEAEDNGNDPHQEIAASIHSVSVVAFIRSYDTSYNQQSATRINIVKAYKAKNKPSGVTVADKAAQIVKEPQQKMSDATCSATTTIQQVQEMEEHVHVAVTADEGTNKKRKFQIENFQNAKSPIGKPAGETDKVKET